MSEKKHTEMDGDAFYQMLLEAHEGLEEQDSHALNMRLVLLMAEKIADLDELRRLFESAAIKE